MLFLYSILYTIAFAVMSPWFLLRRQKYAAGFRQRLGNYPDEFKSDGGKVIWLHCVSVGETNAARPLVAELLKKLPDHRLVISTTTMTGQNLARNIFQDSVVGIFFFPFDWKFSVRRALDHFQPSVVLLLETEIWPRFLHECKRTGTKAAIVNGRLSQRSANRYKRVQPLLQRVLANISAALMQTDADAERIISLGVDPGKVLVTGNLKFDVETSEAESARAKDLGTRFGINGDRLLIVAASTHQPEEELVLRSLDGFLGPKARLLIAPRHPERFDEVANLLGRTSYDVVRRSDATSEKDSIADIILLDSIGELRSVYDLADIVFVGGSMVPHGGQSVFEPANAGNAIVTGPYTSNFDAAIRELLANDAILQTSGTLPEIQVSELREMFSLLLDDTSRRHEVGTNAAALMARSDRTAAARTVEFLLKNLKV